MDFAQLVHAARTCRRFEESQRLSAEDMAWLVDCARVTPSGRNAQVLRFISVSTKEKCEELFPHTRWARALKEAGTPVPGERPTGYIAILWPTTANTLVHMDAGIAAQTMQLAARSKGWGCCMHASFDRSHCPQILQVPEDMEIGLLLGLGVAKEECFLEPMPADGSFDYWRDSQGGHHVPKRDLKECLLAQL